MAEAQIILSHSRESGIVAIASGEQYPRAHTALTESGFQRDNDAFLRQARLSAPHRRPPLLPGAENTDEGGVHGADGV
ncbi:hypothetical protein [Streptomyces ardesiacus]|uniref:hypothetical protein n=1 Tax=Streptomyces ardesiacus TaxID=285564 RepID=UPI002FDC3854